MGLFGLFGNKDSKEKLLAWQNVVCQDKSNTLFMSRKQLEAATVDQVRNSMRIFDDCAKIINSTIKPDVFFSRLELAEEHLKLLASLEPFMWDIKGITINTSLSALWGKYQNEKESYIIDFLYRYYWAVKEKAEKLKTEKGKASQFQKFYDSLIPFFGFISERNMRILESMKNQKI